MGNVTNLIEDWKKPQYPSEFIIKISKKHFNKNSRVLDFGCGGGRNFFFLLDNYDAYACDFFEELVEYVRSKIPEKDRYRVVQNQKIKIPFKDGYFDGILLCGVIGLNRDKEQAIYKEISRCLKDDGLFIIEFTGKSSVISSKLNDLGTDYRLYDKEEIQSELKENFDNFCIGYEEFCFDDNGKKDKLKRWYAYGHRQKADVSKLDNPAYLKVNSRKEKERVSQLNQNDI